MKSPIWDRLRGCLALGGWDFLEGLYRPFLLILGMVASLVLPMMTTILMIPCCRGTQTSTTKQQTAPFPL